MTINQLLNQVLAFGVVGGLAAAAYWLYNKGLGAPPPTPAPPPAPAPSPSDFASLVRSYELLSDDTDELTEKVTTLQIEFDALESVLVPVAREFRAFDNFAREALNTLVNRWW